MAKYAVCTVKTTMTEVYTGYGYYFAYSHPESRQV